MFLDKLEKINIYTDEPLSDLASIPLKFVSDLAAKDVKIVYQVRVPTKLWRAMISLMFKKILIF